jgi:thiol-disulfide isomerase/thioredoxin
VKVHRFRAGARAFIAPVIVTFSFALGACGGAQIPPDARTTALSLDHLDCAECGDKLAAKLRERPGVYRTAFDKRRAELVVIAAPAFDAVTEAKTLSAGEEYAIVLGAGKGHYIAWAKPPEGADVAVIAKEGEDVPDLAPHLVQGKVTVVDFSAVWCEPCRKLDEHMMATVGKRADVAYRKLDVGDWDTPLAKRYLKGVPELPYIIIYSKAGQKVDTVSGLNLAKLDAAIGRGAQ